MAKVHIANINKIFEILSEYFSESFTNRLIVELRTKGGIELVDKSQSQLADELVKSDMILTDAEIEVFNAYLESAITNKDMDIAFGNSDWVDIYNKITRHYHSPLISQLMTKYGTAASTSTPTNIDTL